MEPTKAVTCPLCGQPLANGPTTTTVDVSPYLVRRDPPVSVRVHRACIDALPMQDSRTITLSQPNWN